MGQAYTSSAYLSDLYLVDCLRFCSSDTEQPVQVRTSLRRVSSKLPHWKPCQFGTIHSSLAAAHSVSTAIPHVGLVTHPHFKSGLDYGLRTEFHWPLLVHRSPVLPILLGCGPDQHRVRLLPRSCLIPHSRLDYLALTPRSFFLTILPLLLTHTRMHLPPQHAHLATWIIWRLTSKYGPTPEPFCTHTTSDPYNSSKCPAQLTERIEVTWLHLE